MQPEQTNLIEQLRAAFPLEPIRSAGAFDDWGTTYPDAEPYAQHLEGKTWEELDRAYLTRRSDALSFLGTRHLVAVLPVYLRSLVEEGVWSPAADTLMLLLAKPDASKKTGIKLPRFQALLGAITPEQGRVIAAVLNAFAIADQGGSLGEAARTTLERDWQAYLPQA